MEETDSAGDGIKKRGLKKRETESAHPAGSCEIDVGRIGLEMKEGVKRQDSKKKKSDGRI